MRSRRRWIAPAVVPVALTCALAVAFLAPQASAAGRCGSHPWCDTSLTPAHRAALLLGALTLQERIGLLGGDEASGIGGAAGTHTGTSDGVPRVDLPTFYQTDGPIGVRSGKATALPGSIGLAASFDTGLARQAGALVGNEAKLKGNDLVYAPTVNILRTPLWGRAFESLGEDPYLTSRMAVAYIRALQRQGVIADVKHFAVNNQEGRRVGSETIGSRYTVDAEVGERTLREIYLPAFEAAVKEAGVGSVMCSYNRLNGPHACENRPLLNGILRRDWGFKGFVLADYGASKTVAGGLAAGLDFEPWPFVDSDGGENFTPAVIAVALEAGEITGRTIDAPSAASCARCSPPGSSTARPTYADEPRDRQDRPRRSRAAARRARDGAAAEPRRRAAARPRRRARLARGDRRRRGALRERRRLLEHRPLRVHERPRRGDGAAPAPAGAEVRYDDGSDPGAGRRRSPRRRRRVVVVADTAVRGRRQALPRARLRGAADRRRRARPRRADRGASPRPTRARSSCSRRPARC